jgi:hypothetical protein
MPIKVAITHGNYAAGPSDLLSLGRILGSNVGEIHYTLVAFFIIYSLYSYICINYYRYLNKATVISCSILLSVCTFVHLGYDHLILLAPILIMRSATKATDPTNYILLALCYVLWYMDNVYRILKIKPIGFVSMKLTVEHAILMISIMLLICFYLLFANIRRSMIDGKLKIQNV